MTTQIVGSRFYSGGVSANQVLTVLSPTDNVNGAVLRTATLCNQNGAMTAVVVGRETPTSGSDFNSSPMILSCRTTSGTIDTKTLPASLQVPPGFGIWVVGGSAGAVVGVTYDVNPSA